MKSITEICSALDDLSNGNKYSMCHHLTVSHKRILVDAIVNLILAGLRNTLGCDIVQHLMLLFVGLVLFYLIKDKGMLVNKPFSNWVKLSDMLKTHSQHVYHRDALQSSEVLKTTIENPASRFDVMVSSVLQSQITENKHILQQTVRALIFLAK